MKALDEVLEQHKSNAVNVNNKFHIKKNDAARAELRELRARADALEAENKSAALSISGALFILDNLGLASSVASNRAANDCRAWFAAHQKA